AVKVQPVVHRTPIVCARSLDALVGAPLYLKAENLQRAGSFKIRGAYNKISRLPPETRRRGVVSYSSGNHAQGVALAASLVGVPATIVVPETIVASKRAAAEAYGASLVVAGTTSAHRQLRAEALASERGLAIVPPYDDPAIVAGQGTVALELLEDVPDIDTLVVPIGGGGLMAGCAVLARAWRPGMRIIGVEPLDADDTLRSLQAGHRVRIPPPRTIADGLRAVEPGELTFDVVKHLVDEVVLVSDAEIRHAMRLLLERTKLLVEPSGVVALAAVLARRFPAAGRRLGVVLSGGNIEIDALGELLG
ncbi:MAG: threonine/serine dehydratase, partial [Candidatus Krumholzibacteriia bacterium]